MTRPELTRTIDEVLGTYLAAWGYAGFDLEARADSDGDPAIFIKARFEPASNLPSRQAAIAAIVALRDRLLDAGDDRLPYLDYDYPPDPVATEAA